MLTSSNHHVFQLNARFIILARVLTQIFFPMVPTVNLLIFDANANVVIGGIPSG